MKKKETLFFILILILCLFLAGCGETPDYTDYTDYLTTSRPASSPVSFGDTGNQAASSLLPQPTGTPRSGGTASGSDPEDFANVVTILSTPQPEASAPPAPPAAAPTPTPQPTPSPTPQQNLVRITKSPTSETVAAGGSALFIAYADNSTGIVWITVSPDAKTSFEIGEAPRYFSGLNVSGQGTSTLSLSNIPYEMNGWRIQAYFTGNGGPLYTAGAYLTVTQAGTAVITGEPGSAESYAAALARQAYNDISWYASAYGYAVGSMENYVYDGATAGFNVTVSNGRWRITGEFRAYYYTNSNSGYGPVHAVVYDSAGNQQRSEHLTDKTMQAYFSILDTYR